MNKCGEHLEIVIWLISALKLLLPLGHRAFVGTTVDLVLRTSVFTAESLYRGSEAIKAIKPVAFQIWT